MARMTQAQKDTLEPFAQIMAMIYVRTEGHLESLTDAQLSALEDAVNAADEGNCWCCAFWAARFLKDYIAHERQCR